MTDKLVVVTTPEHEELERKLSRIVRKLDDPDDQEAVWEAFRVVCLDGVTNASSPERSYLRTMRKFREEQA